MTKITDSAILSAQTTGGKERILRKRRKLDQPACQNVVTVALSNDAKKQV